MFGIAASLPHTARLVVLQEYGAYRTAADSNGDGNGDSNGSSHRLTAAIGDSA
jgi:hypothetical protein